MNNANGHPNAAYEFNALRPGEEARTCEGCGQPFVPASRTQRRCPDCRAREESARRRREDERAERARQRAYEAKVERGRDNSLIAVHDALFREMERLEECGDDKDKLETEALRAEKVCDIAGVIVANGRLMVKAAQVSMDAAHAVEAPRALLGRGDGR